MKTREDIIAEMQSEYIELLSMKLEVEGHDETIEFSQDMEDMPQQTHFILPEYSIYHLTICYKIKKPVTSLKYHQVVKKHGIPFKTRNLNMAHGHVNCEDTTPVHSIKFPADSVSGGALIRGKYPAQSRFLMGDHELLTCDWTIEVMKKHQRPCRG